MEQAGMAVRPTMSALISRVRDLIYDPASTTQTFTDAQVQDCLDRHRTVVQYGILRPQITYASGGATNYLDYYADLGVESRYAQEQYGLRFLGGYNGPGYDNVTRVDPLGDWEADERLYDASWNLLSPATSDELTGHWTFSLSTIPPVMIVGKTYDIYAAAIELIDMWLARLALTTYDFGAAGRHMSRSQIIKNLEALRADYRSKKRVRSITLTRGDINAGNPNR